MGLKDRLRSGGGASPEEENENTSPQTLKERMTVLVREKIEELPHVKEVRQFWYDLERERDWWPVLIPLLLLVGWNTYQTERRKVLDEQDHVLAYPEQGEYTGQATRPPRRGKQPSRYRVSVIIHR